MRNSEIKMCPLLIGSEERKAMTYGQGDFVVPIIYPCVRDKCMAYDGIGNCDYWKRFTKIESEIKDESNND